MMLWKTLNNNFVYEILAICMNEELNTYKLRVPSQMELVTITNIRKFIDIIHQLPDTFINSDIANIKEYTLNNEDAISRLLAYFKYLGVLTEERKKETKDGKRVNIQSFHLTDSGKELKKVALYEPGNLDKQWQYCLQNSELYNAITQNEEYQNWNHVSKTTLRKLLGESFSKKVKDKKERIDKAEEYLISFVKEFGLFSFDGNYLQPIGGITKKEKNQEKPKEDERTTPKPDDKTNGIKPKTDSLIFINESNFELNIKKWDDLTLDILNKYTEYKKKNK